jgi:DNA-binding transcriptional MerR regulator
LDEARKTGQLAEIKEQLNKGREADQLDEGKETHQLAEREEQLEEKTMDRLAEREEQLDEKKKTGQSARTKYHSSCPGFPGIILFNFMLGKKTLARFPGIL